nr:MAG TPA: hypothetical protein [Caudoviricetes sp.]
MTNNSSVSTLIDCAIATKILVYLRVTVGWRENFCL